MAAGTGTTSHSSTDSIDPIIKFKVLVPHLKESLQVNKEVHLVGFGVGK